VRVAERDDDDVAAAGTAGRLSTSRRGGAFSFSVVATGDDLVSASRGVVACGVVDCGVVTCGVATGGGVAWFEINRLITPLEATNPAAPISRIVAAAKA
jgi:hypothetical protein